MSDNTGFGPRSTAAEVIDGVDLSGRRAVVTGGASGIGVETARALAAAGAEVVLAVRDVDAGLRVAADIKAQHGVTVKPLDLADQDSVAAFVADWRGPLHILVNNAGVMAMPLTRAPEGWEMQFATNHLGHFALAVGLHDALADEGARVVSVSSGAHRNSPIHFEDIHFRDRAYEPWSAYAQSKTANVLFAVELSTRWCGEGILANAVMPGRISTNLQRHVDPEELDRLRAASDIPADEYYKTPEQGAATSVLLAASPLLEGIGGRYYEDCQEAEVTGPGAKHGVAPHALDPEAAARLWEVSLDTLAQR
jgi:NAD(P)-dependent dehydrogenase (short-subunit alcohol dehydrogenase family)